MLPRDYPAENCSIARTLEVVGDRWTLLIVREILRGVIRFDDLTASLEIAKNILADRLGRLADEGILERREYRARPARHEYVATSKGRALWPVLVAMLEWGDRHYAPKGAPRIVLHQGCGGHVSSSLMCDACDACDTSGTSLDLMTVAGPGSRARKPAVRGSA